MPSILGANSVSGDLITNSLCFNKGDSAKLSFTQGTPTSRRTWTYSTWVKRGNLADQQESILSWGDEDFFDVRFQDGTPDDGLIVYISDGDSKNVATNRLFRDPSAWYHIVVASDTTDGTAGDRTRIYVNGVEETSFAAEAQPDQNYDYRGLVSGDPIVIGNRYTGSHFFDGYLADTYFIDGQQLAPTSFGETNDNGVWIPKKYSGSYGTNGFHLEYKQTGTSANAAGIGADTSGNGNHFTPTNLAATDIGIDTPQNNYCTINSVYADDGNNLVAADFSEGNRKMLSTVDGWKFGRGTFLLEAGKWYVEVKATEAGAGENGRFGLQPSQGGEALGNTDDNDTFEGINVGFAGSDTNLLKLDTGSGSTIFSDFSSGSIAQLAFDLDNDKVWIGRNGTWYNNNNASSTLDASNHDFALPSVDLGWVFGLGMTRNGSNNITFEYNWGNPSFAISSGNSDADGHGNFEYAVPSGFFAVNSKNLAEYG